MFALSYFKLKPRAAAAAALAAGMVLAATTQASADAVADFYRGKQVDVMIGFAPGGGYDAYGRLLIRHMGRHIPGNPDMIAVNMPGAGSLRLANFIYNKAPRTGGVLGIFASSSAFGPLLGVRQAKFDTAKFTWIGNFDQSIGTCTTWHSSGIKSFDDLRKGQPVFGASGPTSVNSEHARGFNALLGTNIKVIHGYPGSTSVLLAMKRGEVQGGCGFALSSLKAARRNEWKSGKLKVLIQTGKHKAPELAGVPHIYDMVDTEGEKQVLDLIYGRHILGRPVAAPPGIPADRREALRTAFMATMKDPAFLKEAQRMHLTINPWSGAEVDKQFAVFLNYPKDVVMRARAAMKKGNILRVKLKEMAGTLTKVGKKRITVSDTGGKSYVFKISGRRSKVKLAGKKAKTSALKAGLNCDLRYLAVGDLALNIACK